jgi:site-specific DNA recombinase
MTAKGKNTSATAAAPKRVALLLRVSMFKLFGYSLETQEHDLRQYCVAMGWAVVAVYTDNGISGATIEKRPAFLQMMADARKKKFDLVGVFSLSRFSRSAVDTQILVRELYGLGIHLFSCSEAISLDNASARFAFRQMGNVNELERDLVSERVSRNMATFVRNGGWVGPPPTGYRNDPETRGLAINPLKAPAVRMAFAMALKGKGYWAIAVRLNRLGYTTQQDNPFTPVAVRDILRNEAYTGVVKFTVRAHDIYLPNRQRPVKEHIREEGTHDPLIKKKTWLHVQAILDSRAGRVTRNPAHRQLLITGLLRCPECGAGMVTGRSQAKGGTRTHDYYICGRAARSGARKEGGSPKQCRWNGVNADAVEAVVLRRVARMMRRQRVADDVTAYFAQRQRDLLIPAEELLASLEKERARLQKLRKKYQRDYDNGRIPGPVFADGLARVEEGLAACQLEEERLASEAVTPPEPAVSGAQVRAVLGDLKVFFAALPVETQRALLRAFLEKITLGKDRDPESAKLHLLQGVSQAIR